MYDFIRSKTKAKIFMHSCGSVYDIIPDLIEAGVEILNPLQCSAAKMDLSVLKREFGRELCFWGGGIDVQQVLPFATLQEIEDIVRRTIDTMAPGGGYIFVPAHNIQPDIPPERIFKVYETALGCRDYRVIRGVMTAEDAAAPRGRPRLKIKPMAAEAPATKKAKKPATKDAPAKEGVKKKPAPKKTAEKNVVRKKK
jgi:hypothetical protein